METLWTLYQTRLDQLNETFLHLLSEFEDSQLLTTPQLAKYRLQYLGEIIQKTLQNDQQKLINKLYAEIDQLQIQNVALRKENQQLSRVFSSRGAQENETKEKSLGSTKISTIRSKKQITDDSSDSFLSVYRASLPRSRNKNSRSNLTLKFSQENEYSGSKVEKERKPLKQHSMNETQELQETQIDLQTLSCSFKYLKL